MPELPEVETVATGLNALVRGLRIESVWLSSKPQTFKTPAGEMAQQLSGRRIAQVRRVGKHIVFDLDAEDKKAPHPPLIVYLGMTGQLLVSAAEAPILAHSHPILRLGRGR